VPNSFRKLPKATSREIDFAKFPGTILSWPIQSVRPQVIDGAALASYSIFQTLQTGVFNFVAQEKQGRDFRPGPG
jgi:hypothetical protein